jgi:hypothetical protein
MISIVASFLCRTRRCGWRSIATRAEGMGRKQASARSACRAFLLVGAAALSGAPARGEPPLPPVRPPDLQREPDRPAPAALPPAPSAPASGACLAKLRADRVEAEAIAEPAATLADCGIAEPVRLTSIGLAGGATLDLPGRPTLDCAFAATFAEFARDVTAPLGVSMLGSPVVALDTGPGYACRGRNQVQGAKTSAHGEGVAIDVAAILLADKRRVAIAEQAGAEETLFVRTMRRAACGWFTTVLGPGSDPSHATHLHLDTLRHGATDNYRICE